MTPSTQLPCFSKYPLSHHPKPYSPFLRDSDRVGLWVIPGARAVLSPPLSLPVVNNKGYWHRGDGGVKGERTLFLLLSFQDPTQRISLPQTFHSSLSYLTSPSPLFQLNCHPAPEFLECQLLFFYSTDHLEPYDIL